MTHNVTSNDFGEPGVNRAQVFLQLGGSPRMTRPAGVAGNNGCSSRYFFLSPFGSNECEVLLALQADFALVWDLHTTGTMKVTRIIGKRRGG